MDELDAIARTEIQAGWDVYDADGERIGEVGEVNTGSFSVDGVTGARLDVDFTDVESADDGRVTLMLSGDELSTAAA
jgi:hypothetical protein